MTETELKLTNGARSSLEELRLDYQDFLRQSGSTEWPPNHPALMRFKSKRCATLEQVRAWVSDERKRHTDIHGPSRTNTEKLKPASSAQLVANAALSLLNLVRYLLGRQLATQAETFEEKGGFTERLYRIRTARKNKPNHPS